MLDLVAPMSLVLMSWLLLFLLFSGLGMMALRLIGKPCASGWDWLDSFWLGWALSLATLQIWHFFFPVNEMILLLLALLAASQLIAQRESVASLLMRLRGQRAYLLGLALLALWLSNRALAMPTAYDSGFRDIQAVMWIDAYPIVPGLGNLFSSLAFNHSVYLYDALLDVSVWSGRSQHIATGLLLMTYLAGALRSSLNLGACRSAGAIRWTLSSAASSRNRSSSSVTWTAFMVLPFQVGIPVVAMPRVMSPRRASANQRQCPEP